MTARLLLLVLLCGWATTPASAQSRASAHPVPLASEGNALVLHLVSLNEPSTEAVTVTAPTVPAWLHLSPERVQVALASPSGEAEARFRFDVDEHAPLGDSTTLRFEIAGAEGQRWEKEIRLVVEAPRVFALEPAYPNPFSSSAAVPLLLPQAARVRLVLYDVLGRRVLVVADERFEAGHHTVRLDGHHLASGAYVLQGVMRPEDQGVPQVFRQRLTLVR